MTARTAAELLARQAAAAPDAVAIDTGQDRWTYRELAGAADRLTAQLAGGGTPAAVLVPAGPQAVALMFALLASGTVFTWLDPAAPAARHLAVAADCGARMLIAGQDQAGSDTVCQAVQAGLAVAVLAGSQPELTSSGTGPAAGTVPRPAPHPAPRPAQPDGLACVLYTSGSQGAPKGILQSQDNIAAFASWFGTEFGMGPGARLLRWASFAYDAVFAEVIGVPAAGGTVVMPEFRRDDPGAVLAALGSYGITHFQCVPSFARQLLGLIRARGVAPRDLRVLLLAGEALTPDLVAAVRELLPGTGLVNLYGPTETILATWHRTTAADAAAASVPVGRAIPGRRVSVVRADGSACPAGQEGEILVAGDELSLGYLGTAGHGGRFAPAADGSCGFWTGDRGLLRDDGLLEYRGRLDGQVKVHGNRVEPAEAEAALLADPLVLGALVTAREHNGDTVLTALVVAPGADPAGLRRAMAGRVPGYLVPRDIEIVAELPRLVSGKLDRAGVPPAGRPATQPAGQAAAPGGGQRPGGDLTAVLGAAWSAVLGGDPAGPDDDFFDRGGDSLAAARVIVRVAEAAGTELPLEAFLEAPRFADLAAYLAAAAARSVPRQRQ